MPVIAAAGCGSAKPAARPLTAAEAERLAAIRLVDYDAGGSAFTSSFTGPDGNPVAVQGRVDWKRGVGEASLSTNGATLDDFYWNGRSVALRPHKGPGRWVTRPLMPRSSVLDRVLTAVQEVSGDRPDNPQLLQQGGALWTGTGRVGGVRADVFRGPSGRTSPTAPTPQAQEPEAYFWVDKDSRLLRFESRAASDPFTIDFTSQGPQVIQFPQDTKNGPAR